MKSNSTCIRLLLLCMLVCSSDLLFGQTGSAQGVATFECIGITWSGSGGNAATTCNVKYRVAGSGSAWKDGYPLWFDSRAAGGGSTLRPANEYRGSIVKLTPGTSYEIQLSLEGNTVTNTFTCTTWSETFPIGTTHTVNSSSATLNITSSGTAGSYELYTGTNATIDVNNGADNCIYINASYVIVRGLTLKNAKADAIRLGPNAHDIVIEQNDISGWGRIAADGFGVDGDAGVHAVNATSIERIIIQRNRIHHPRSNSNSWEQTHTTYNTNHPAGPQAVMFETVGGNHVIRYNNIYSDATHYFNDGIGGAENFSYEGFPRANSDIYGNKISQTWDDGIESEGANMNVRIWGNFLDSTFVKIAVASTSIGPVYIFRNVANTSRRSGASDAATVDNEDRGPFIKAGTSYTQFSGGKIFVFHNTILQPVAAGYTYAIGCGGGILDWGGGPMTPVESRNNILQIHKSWWQSIGDNYASQTDNDFNYDLYNGIITGSNGQEPNGITGTPVYNGGSIANGWPLTSSSEGYDAGLPLNNFSDGYTGAGPDAGAYEAGLAPLQFGVDAYLTNPPPPPPPPPTNQPPVARAGADQTITLPLALVILDGSASTDPEGGTLTYKWAKINGPATLLITTPLLSLTTVTGLGQGTYTFELTVTDDSGATATDEVVIKVNPLIPPPNQPPTANAGNNISITLPVDYTTLTGTGTDPEGGVLTYQWTRVNGPTTYTFGNANAASTSLTGLVQGTYTFRLTVTDNGTATATDDVTVTVNPAVVPPPPPPPPTNQPPTANAGNNITMTLPLNYTTLTGSAADVDGAIISYRWTWVSGPATYLFGNAALISTPLTGLVQGVYTFRLTVTDNDNATATDDITVTVNPAPVPPPPPPPPPPTNQPPVARAGNDITLIMPVDSTILYGIGSTDPDGLIAVYEWTVLSGPSAITIANNRSSNIKLKGLQLGEYTFQLKVTDNGGATATTIVHVTVKNKNEEDVFCNIYPNPVKTNLTVQYISTQSGEARLLLYNSNRQLVLDEIVTKSQSILLHNIDMSPFMSGTYFLEIIMPDGKNTVKKVVKL